MTIRYRRWLGTLADDRKNATAPAMWLGTACLVIFVLVATAYIHPLSKWFQLRFWPAFGCFVPCFLLGFIGGHLESRGRLSLRTYGLLVLIGNTLLQFFFAALVAFSRPPGSFALASLFVLTVAFHGYLTRASARFPYTLFGVVLALGAATAINPEPETLTVFAFMGPTAMMVCLLTGASGLREHQDRRERDKLRQAIYYRALNETAAEREQMSERVIHLLRYNHDAANALSSVFLNAQLLGERLGVLGVAASAAEGVESSMSRLLEQLTRLKSLIADANRVADELPTTLETSTGNVIEEVAAECRQMFPQVVLETAFAAQVALRVRVHDGETGLRRILQNVLHNACEGNGSSAATRVRLEVANEGIHLELRCLDDGPGFGAEQLEDRIKPFRTTKPNGHGLGLFNVSQLVQASGGELLRSNNPKGGAVVQVRLALSAADCLEPTSTVRTRAQASRPGRAEVVNS